jgi:hypothetical protein
MVLEDMLNKVAVLLLGMVFKYKGIIVLDYFYYKETTYG